MTETYAGMLARTLPELGGRELACLASENAGPTVTVRWVAGWQDGAVRAITDRAGDALEVARVKLCIDAFNEMRERPVAYSECAAYWVAIP